MVDGVGLLVDLLFFVNGKKGVLSQNGWGFRALSIPGAELQSTLYIEDFIREAIKSVFSISSWTSR